VVAADAIFFVSCRRFKLGDFGLAIDTTLERSKSRVGTLDYMSPEVSVMQQVGNRAGSGGFHVFNLHCCAVVNKLQSGQGR
jgi:serine/threonine protein kinase